MLANTVLVVSRLLVPASTTRRRAFINTVLLHAGSVSESMNEFTWKLSIKAHTNSCSIYVQNPRSGRAGCL